MMSYVDELIWLQQACIFALHWFTSFYSKWIIIRVRGIIEQKNLFDHRILTQLSLSRLHGDIR